MNNFPNTHKHHLAQAVLETQIGGSWKSTWGKCYYVPVLFFSRRSILAADWHSAGPDELLVSLSTAISSSYDTIHLCPELRFPFYIQMKDRSKTAVVTLANSLNTGISVFFLHMPSSSAKLRKGLSSTVHLVGNQGNTIRGMFLKLPSSD